MGVGVVTKNQKSDPGERIKSEDLSLKSVVDRK